MTMTPKTPHTCSSTRIVRADKETHAAPTDILSGEPCYFTPWAPQTQDTTFGPAELNRYILFVGYDADIQLGDEITRDDTAETFTVYAPPQKFDNPRNDQPDHQQVWIRKQPMA